jgi:2-oxoglutarate dehydrogenase E1 component
MNKITTTNNKIQKKNEQVKEQLNLYKNAEVVWCQEEHMNGGAWFFVKERINKCLSLVGTKKQVKYVGRGVSASTATGISLQHKLQKEKMISEALQ